MESSPIPAGNSSSDFSLDTDFLLIPSPYSGLDGVLIDDEKKDMPLYVTVNSVFLFLEGLFLPTPCWQEIIKPSVIQVQWVKLI